MSGGGGMTCNQTGESERKSKIGEERTPLAKLSFGDQVNWEAGRKTDRPSCPILSALNTHPERTSVIPVARSNDSPWLLPRPRDRQPGPDRTVQPAVKRKIMRSELAWVGVARIGLVGAIFVAAFLAGSAADAQPLPNAKYDGRPDPFYPIDMWLASPNEQRLGSGAPGPGYWQQRADYEIDVSLDDERQRLSGRESVTYENRSPHSLDYLWFQLEQNAYRPDSEALMTATAPNLEGRVPFSLLRSLLARQAFPGGFEITAVTDDQQQPLPFTVVGTAMRVDLAKPLAPGEIIRVKIDFGYRITDAKLIRGRGGFEFFSADKNYIYEIAQWFPRLVAYTDYAGWQHEPFIGYGEFNLEFGDYVVRITVPSDMIVAASGELQNPDDVLTPEQVTRLREAATAEKPIFIVTPEEAKAAEKRESDDVGTKTWEFRAENVRDFAFAASRKFIWDAVGHPVTDRTVMAMSYYPNEAEPLWSQYSTASIAHTLDVYGKFTFDYPYPVAISVNGPVYGMEYPMICFNGPRPESDGTYSKATKYGLISVIIHEVGHNWFPMIVNSDERRWSWMDEGLNTFLQYLAEQEWEEDYPSRRGEPGDITGYMRSNNQRPIMTQSESILQFGNNAYAKPATALNILRETILGREVFDFAFKQYANRWRFKRPMPEDFFRTMSDASGHSLDWFWRGWFFSTDHVDIALDGVKLYQIDSDDPDQAAETKRAEKNQRPQSISDERNAELPKRIDLQPGLKDFYNEYDEFEVTEEDRKTFRRFIDGLDSDERKLLQRQTNFYVLSFRNVGGLISPIIIHLVYEDGSNERIYVPATIWRTDPRAVKKLVITDKTIRRIEIDPQQQTADCDQSNNHWPPQLVPSRFKLFKSSQSKNPMQKAKAADDEKQKDAKKEAAKDDDAKPGNPEKDNAKRDGDQQAGDKKKDVKKGEPKNSKDKKDSRK